MRGVEPLHRETRTAPPPRRGPWRNCREPLAWREIHIERLTFTHQEGEDVLQALREVDLTIRGERQKIALIGESGSGKTTLLTLMRGLYQAQQVSLAVDGACSENLYCPLARDLPRWCLKTARFSKIRCITISLLPPMSREDVVKQALSISTFDDVAAKLPPRHLDRYSRARGEFIGRTETKTGAGARPRRGAQLIAASARRTDQQRRFADGSRDFRPAICGFCRQGNHCFGPPLRILLRKVRSHICFMRNGVIEEQGSFTGLPDRRGAFHRLWQASSCPSGGRQGIIERRCHAASQNLLRRRTQPIIAVIRPGPWVGIGIVIWRGDKVLLVKRGNAPRKGEWGLPGGGQQTGETIMQAAMREAREETGLAITPLGIITAIDVLTRDDKGKIEFHYTIIETVAESDKGEARACDDAKGVRWATIDEVEKLCAWPEVARVARLSLLQRAL